MKKMREINVIRGSTEPDPIQCIQCGHAVHWHWTGNRYLHPGDICEECSEGARLEREEREREAKLVRIAQNIGQHLERAGVPSNYCGRSLDNFVCDTKTRQDACHKAADYANRLKTNDLGKCYGLFLTGPSGVGKTHLAVGVVREYLLMGKAAKFYGLKPLEIKLKDSFKEGSGLTEAALLDMASTIPLLVLDDLGQETMSSYMVSIIYMLANQREYEGLPYVVTSNLSVGDIANNYSQQIADRISGNCDIVKIFCGSWRLKK